MWSPGLRHPEVDPVAQEYVEDAGLPTLVPERLLHHDNSIARGVNPNSGVGRADPSPVTNAGRLPLDNRGEGAVPRLHGPEPGDVWSAGASDNSTGAVGCSTQNGVCTPVPSTLSL